MYKFRSMEIQKESEEKEKANKADKRKKKTKKKKQNKNSKFVCECLVKQIVVGNIVFVTFAPIGAPEREYDVSLRGFGKTVFLSREEAERAMEGKKDGNETSM